MRVIFQGLGRVLKVVLGIGIIVVHIVLECVGLILGAITKQ